jgi:KDO2-lipid IV(A) lauroyltransferase
MALRRGILCFPLPWALRLGSWLGMLAFGLLRHERHKTLNNLKMAYGSAFSPDERRRLAREVFRNAGRASAELAFLWSGQAGNLLTHVRVEGLEHMLQVLESGRGILILSAHFGNWELMAPLFARTLPCQVGAVARDLRNPGLNREVLTLRKRLGIHIFRRGHSGRDYVRFLRTGNALGILGDIDTKSGNGLFVPFFGRPAWTQRGIAELALLGKARVVPAFLARDPRDPQRHVLRVEPALPEPEGLDKEQWIEVMTQAFTQAIEQAVRRQPEQWMWMHRRWRHRPDTPGHRRRQQLKIASESPHA